MKSHKGNGNPGKIKKKEKVWSIRKGGLAKNTSSGKRKKIIHSKTHQIQTLRMMKEELSPTNPAVELPSKTQSRKRKIDQGMSISLIGRKNAT